MGRSGAVRTDRFARSAHQALRSVALPREPARPVYLGVARAAVNAMEGHQPSELLPHLRAFFQAAPEAVSRLHAALGVLLRGETARPQDESVDLTPLRARYDGLDEPGVVAFLRGHPEAVVLLGKASPSVAEFFGRDARVELRTEQEYSGNPTLYATILGEGEDLELLGRLDRFDEAWWLDNMAPAAGRVVFTVGRA